MIKRIGELEDKYTMVIDGQEIQFDKDSYLGRIKYLVDQQTEEMLELIEEIRAACLVEGTENEI